MARKVVRVSDISGEEIPDGRGATIRITYLDDRRGSRELDVTDQEAEKMGGPSGGPQRPQAQGSAGLVERIEELRHEIAQLRVLRRRAMYSLAAALVIWWTAAMVILVRA